MKLIGKVYPCNSKEDEKEFTEKNDQFIKVGQAFIKALEGDLISLGEVADILSENDDKYSFCQTFITMATGKLDLTGGSNQVTGKLIELRENINDMFSHLLYELELEEC